MARSDLLLELVRASTQNDRGHFRRVVEALIAEERAKQHNTLADRLSELIQTLDRNGGQTALARAPQAHGLLIESVPKRSMEELVLTAEVRRLSAALVEEQLRADLLRSHGLEPRNRLLLVGPPGNGKTSLAEAIAAELMVPLVSIRYEAVIGSFLGETAQRLAQVFDYVVERQCVLLLDEFETLGKERGDEHETGEIKRVVSSLLLQIDRLPTYVVVVAASNHEELLDRAIWRRFQIILEMPKPSSRMISEWLRKFEKRTGLELRGAVPTMAQRLARASFADVEECALGVAREMVLREPSPSIQNAVDRALGTWELRLRSKHRATK